MTVPNSRQKHFHISIYTGGGGGGGILVFIVFSRKLLQVKLS